MLNFIKRFFFKENNYETEEAAEKLSSLTIEVNLDGTLNIICDWPEFDENNNKQIANVAKYYALAIHALNEGLLDKEIIDTLKNYDNSNPFNNLFVHNTLVELINLEKIKKENNPLLNKPIISPLDVFKGDH